MDMITVNRIAVIVIIIMIIVDWPASRLASPGLRFVYVYIYIYIYIYI